MGEQAAAGQGPILLRQSLSGPRASSSGNDEDREVVCLGHGLEFVQNEESFGISVRP
jgi:hypothetical protein